MSKKNILFICLGILLSGVGGTVMIFMTEPTAKHEGTSKETAMLVDVVQVERGDFFPTIKATGTVQPVEDIMLSPRVNGQVVRRSPGFSPGGFVKKGQVLLQIDPSDYQNVLELRKSELKQAEADLRMEMGRQQVAQMDYELIGDSLSPEKKALVLRQPQLESIKAAVQSAKAAVSQAQLDLDRTAIRAPFDAHILNRNVTVGSQVSSGDNLGRLIGAENYWVVVTVPVSQLQLLTFPSKENEKGSKVNIVNRSSWKKGSHREGYLYKRIGALDDQTRLARVLVMVPDPLAQEMADSLGRPQLMVGAFVEAQLIGNEIDDVIRVDRDYIRNNQTVWVMEDGKLSIQPVEILFSDEQYAYINKGLKDQDRVVTTNLSTVVDGVGLRLKEDSVSTSQPVGGPNNQGN
ncbi:efflux RND transporter periplasmic adaptor subunit [Echinicola jeungdonensis]|uniref:Efflux RND transporter periplasmic adaptor subunit n=1 Tax=Echinicola jeungdonensis TaxID=709343 RepID=A0ABV5J7B8_9BACT|nr:efflux RND transporter periplasmic adaptor subunit [Echinicola jeungdonensis]MDN3669803.1 efflux RND transporter periplasmic adaptor subunit [Echinicola jeungdonensis]